MLWIWTLVALNTIIRLAIVFINIPLILVSYGGLAAYANDLSATFSVIIALTPVVDILTALSLLYLYHILGLKQRRISTTERCESMTGLVNSTQGAEYLEEIDIEEVKNFSKKLTFLSDVSSI